jgi:hypothetical protein
VLLSALVELPSQRVTNALRFIEASPSEFEFVACLAERALESRDLGRGALLDVVLLASQVFFFSEERAVLMLKSFVVAFQVFPLSIKLPSYCRQLLLGFQPCLDGSSLPRIDERAPMLVSDGSNEIASRRCYLCFEVTAQCGP